MKFPCFLAAAGLMLVGCSPEGGGGAVDPTDGGQRMASSDGSMASERDAAPDAEASSSFEDGGTPDGRSGGEEGGVGHAGREVFSAEVCDGVDNDGDGQVDNVDAEGDGVCDCLNIATIGQIGGWSTGGNVFKTWLNSRSPAGAVELGDQVLTDELLRPFQVIVVLHVGTTEEPRGSHVLTPHHTFSDDEAAALERWVRNGGGLMTTIGYSDENSEVVNVNRLLMPLEMAYSTTLKDTHGFIESWESHPVTDGVSRILTDNGVEPDGQIGVTLARDGGDRVALQVGQPDDGRIVVWGDEWITYDSEWQDTEEQQVDRFWLNMLKWLSPPKVCQVDIPLL